MPPSHSHMVVATRLRMGHLPVMVVSAALPPEVVQDEQDGKCDGEQQVVAEATLVLGLGGLQFLVFEKQGDLLLLLLELVAHLELADAAVDGGAVDLVAEGVVGLEDGVGGGEVALGHEELVAATERLHLQALVAEVAGGGAVEGGMRSGVVAAGAVEFAEGDLGLADAGVVVEAEGVGEGTV